MAFLLETFRGFIALIGIPVCDCTIFGNPADWRSECVGAEAPSEEKVRLSTIKTKKTSFRSPILRGM